MSIEAMKQALEALENNRWTHYYCEDTWYSCPKHEEGCANDSEGDECNCGADKANAEIEAAIAPLRKALEQAEKQEPVAWRYQNGITETEYLVWQKGTGGRNWTPLYAEPLPCPTCQSLARAVMMDQTGKA